jgi:hypothetical protein
LAESLRVFSVFSFYTVKELSLLLKKQQGGKGKGIFDCSTGLSVVKIERKVLRVVTLSWLDKPLWGFFCSLLERSIYRESMP